MACTDPTSEVRVVKAILSPIVITLLLNTSSPAVVDPISDPVSCRLRFSLDEQQVQEVRRLRLFRPTAAQLAVLRAVDPDADVLYRVVTRHLDCGCGRHSEVTWVDEREVEASSGYISWIPGYSRLEYYLAAAEEDSVALHDLAAARARTALADTSAAWIAAQEHGDNLVISGNYETYHRGWRVSDAQIAELFSLRTSRAAADSTVSSRLGIQLPPPGMISEERLLERIASLAAEAARFGIELEVVE